MKGGGTPGSSKLPTHSSHIHTGVSSPQNTCHPRSAHCPLRTCAHAIQSRSFALLPILRPFPPLPPFPQPCPKERCQQGDDPKPEQPNAGNGQVQEPPSVHKIRHDAIPPPGIAGGRQPPRLGPPAQPPRVARSLQSRNGSRPILDNVDRHTHLRFLDKCTVKVPLERWAGPWSPVE